MTERDPASRPASATAALSDLDPTAALPPTASADADADPTIALGAGSGRSREPIRAARRAGFGFAGFALKRSHAIAAAAVLVVVLLIVVIAASGGGGTTKTLQPVQLQPAPESAPSDAQINELEKIVRAAPGR
jgi:hypothetical protein